MAPNPLLRLVLRAERAASGPINRAANSQEAADLLLQIGHIRRTAGDVIQRIRAGSVHALALPSHRDLELLEAKVERLQRTLEERLAGSHHDEVR
jgi:hypothetical protein